MRLALDWDSASVSSNGAHDATGVWHDAKRGLRRLTTNKPRAGAAHKSENVRRPAKVKLLRLPFQVLAVLLTDGDNPSGEGTCGYPECTELIEWRYRSTTCERSRAVINPILNRFTTLGSLTAP